MNLSYRAQLTDLGKLSVPIPGFRPQELDDQLKAIPGGRWNSTDGAWEWGWSPEVAERVEALGIELADEVKRVLVREVRRPGPNERTPVAQTMEQLELIWRSRTQPREHQRDFKVWRRGGGHDEMIHPGALLEAGKGVGKTLSAIEEIKEQLAHKPDALILILARNSNLYDPWETQLVSHGGFVPGIDFVPLDGPRKDRLAWLTHIDTFTARIWIHNHEDLPAMGKYLRKVPWTMIILDESSRMRTAGAKRTKLLTGQFNLDAPNKLALSGAPMIKRVSDLYPTLKWLGAPTGNKAEFLERFVVLGGFSGTEELAIKDVAGLNRLLDCYRFVVPKGSVQNLPRAWHRHTVELKPWQRESYKRIQKDLRSRWVSENGEVSEKLIANRLGELLRLAQVTAGFEAIDTEHFNWRDDNAKTEVLVNEVLPDYAGEKVMLWAHWQPEVENLYRILAAAGRQPACYYGGQTNLENKVALASFKEGTIDTLILNTAKGSAGLNMPMAHTSIYYTRTFSTEDWMQSLDRNDRLDTVLEAGEVLNVDIVEAKDTVDERVDMILGNDVATAAQVTALDVKAILGVR